MLTRYKKDQSTYVRVAKEEVCCAQIWLKHHLFWLIRIGIIILLIGLYRHLFLFPCPLQSVCHCIVNDTIPMPLCCANSMIPIPLHYVNGMIPMPLSCECYDSHTTALWMVWFSCHYVVLLVQFPCHCAVNGMIPMPLYCDWYNSHAISLCEWNNSQTIAKIHTKWSAARPPATNQTLVCRNCETASNSA